jgi:glycosyltransferase involved in cell wall biosynthesis
MLNNFNYDVNNLRLLYDPVDLDIFKSKDKNYKLMEKYNIPSDKFIISTVGRLSRNKGHKTIIKTLKKLNKEIIYVIIGDGYMKQELQYLVSSLNLKERVFFTGRIPENELIDFYNIADIVSLLSTFDKYEGEGLPLGLIEASACKKPIIAGNQDGSQEAISDILPNGFAIDPLSSTELKNKVMFF